MEPARKFKIIINSKECGTCSGPTPSAVAKKVVKKLCGTSSKVVRFSLKECKRGCEWVCGPYHGRMEKLDRPYKRDGKTITHRVVCGKVRKMRGAGLGFFDLDIFFEFEFEKQDPNSDFKFESFALRPYIFFFPKLQKKYMDKSWFRFAILNNEIFGENKTISILGLKFTDLNNNIYLSNDDPSIIHKFIKIYNLKLSHILLYKNKNKFEQLSREIGGFLQDVKDNDQLFHDMLAGFEEELTKLEKELRTNHPQNKYKTIKEYLPILIRATSNIQYIDSEYFVQMREPRELRVEDFNFSKNFKDYNMFELKYINGIPYLFLYSKEMDNLLEKKHNFAISNKCDIFMYKNGEIKLLNLNMNELKIEEIILFTFLNKRYYYLFLIDGKAQHGTILDIIKNVYPNFEDIIKCLEKLHSMYERNKRHTINENHA
jgi:hypothetical protein